MASSDGDMVSSGTTAPVPPSLEELSRRGVRALLLPWIIGIAASSPSTAPRELVVLVNLGTGLVTMIDDATDLEVFMRSKDRQLPASKASIDAMPAVAVKEEGFECAICLTEFEVNGEAKEMPCKHRYHSGCIEKWLKIHGSCPICRYIMPAEEDAENTKGDEVDGTNNNSDGDSDGGDGERRDGAGFVFHILVSRSARSQSGSDMDPVTGREENETTDDGSDSRSAPGSGGDNDGSTTQEMAVDR